MDNLHFISAYDEQNVSAVRELLTEYAHGQGLRPENSNVFADIAALPGRYSPPEGRLYLVRLGDENVGCGGLVPLKDGDCEMKRLYVKPAYRGRGIARALSQKLIDDARAIGYHRVTLSTKNEWAPALNLYLSMGFTDTPQMRFSKMNDLRWLGLKLTKDGRPQTAE